MREASLSLRAIGPAWNRFFHEPADPRFCAFLRIGFAALVILNFAFSYPWVEWWWSESGFLPMAGLAKILNPKVWTLFHHLPHTDEVLWACYWTVIVQAFLLMIGLFSRFNLVCVFVWLVTFQHRNPMITDGEDTMLRLYAFLLFFMPLADLWSVDAKIWKRDPSKLLQKSGWAVRLLQIQMCVVFWSAGVHKLAGGMWWNGFALYNVMHLDDFYGHLPVPQFITELHWLTRPMTWVSMWIELGAPVLIWFKETRRYALLAILSIHIGMEYMMNVFLFEFIMILGWMSHVRPGDWQWLKSMPSRLFNRGLAARS